MNVHTPPPATIDLATIKQYEVLPRVETLRLRGPRRMAARRHTLRARRASARRAPQGDGSRTVVCDAVQLVVPTGLFATAQFLRRSSAAVKSARHGKR
jgi:hypothetical protein